MINPKESLGRSLRFGLAALAITVACDNGAGEIRDTSSIATITSENNLTEVAPTISSRIAPEIPESVLDYFYPELLSSNLRTTSFQDVDIKYSGIPTGVYNFTEYELNSKAVDNIYEVFEFMAASNIAYDYPAERFRRKIHVTGQPLNLRISLVLPSNAPDLEDAGNFANRRALTIISLDFPAAFSIIRDTNDQVGIFQSPEEMLTVNFAIEACNQTLDVQISDSEGQIEDTRQKLFARELVCNSFGTAVAARLLGKSFQEYDAFIRRRTLSFGPDYRPSQGEFQLLPVDQISYESFPASGAVAK